MKILKTTLLATILLGTTLSPTQASDVDDTIKLRKVVMGSLRWAGLNVMGSPLPENKKQQQNFVGQARQFVASAEMIPVTFKTKALGKDSSVKTHVKDLEDIWTNWPQFTKQSDQMLTDAKGVLTLAEAGDYAGAQKAAGKAFKANCKACHDKFQDN